VSARLSIHEHEIEDELARVCAQAGHLCLKFVSPGFPGVPDRILLAKNGRTVLVEVKAPGQKPRRTQPAVIKALRAMGHRVEIIDTKAQIPLLLKDLAA
jgi:hypothetical protein